MNEDLIFRLRKRAEIRRQIPNRKSVQQNEPDRLADLLEESANALEEVTENDLLFLRYFKKNWKYSEKHDVIFNLSPTCDNSVLHPNDFAGVNLLKIVGGRINE